MKKNCTPDEIADSIFKTKLSRVITERGLTIKSAAAEIGCTRQYLGDLANGKISCGRNMAFKITKWSCGRVDPLELMTQGRIAKKRGRFSSIFRKKK